MKDWIERHIKSKRGKTYTHEYRDKQGRLVSKKVVEEITKGLYIPPAWKDVKISKHRREKVLAIGYDTKGRAQYVYNPTFKESQSDKKFEKMKEFGKAYPAMMRRIQRDIYTVGDSKETQIAIVLRLVTECCFRIGNEKYERDNKSYGITTLEKHHIKVQGDNVTIDFVGKKGVRNKCTIRQKKLSRIMKTKKRNARKGDKLFTYRKNDKFYDVKPYDVNRYLKQFGAFSVKDFRTWIANLELIHQLIKQDSASDSESETVSTKQKQVNHALDIVAEKLHNTRSVCKQNYVDPYVMRVYVTDTPTFKKFFATCTTKEEIAQRYISLLQTR
jgi:DNA topoisomerase-1